MKCPKCGFEQPIENTECLKCGIVFEKYRNLHALDSIPPDIHPVTDIDGAADRGSILQILFYVKPDTHPIAFGGRAFFFLVLCIWGFKIILTSLSSNYEASIFWHLVNLPFHEAGHIVFRIFGRFLTSLGGSLGQLLMPLVCLIAFLLHTRDAFAAAFSLWWLGENFIDIAPYINDARSLTLPLLGGNTGADAPYGFHDWEYILKESGLIRHDQLIAAFSNRVGIMLMMCALVWGALVLFKQYKLIRPSGRK